MPPFSKFGERVREGRDRKSATERRPYTQADLARDVAKSRNTVDGWENRSVVPAPHTRVRVAEALGVSVDWIEGKADDPGRHNGAGTRAVREQTPPYGASAVELEFGSTAARQRALLRVQELLVEFAEAGADDEFVTWARQFLLNPDNFVHSVGGAAGKSFEMSDEDKVRHLETLALVPRGILAHRNKKGRK